MPDRPRIPSRVRNTIVGALLTVVPALATGYVATREHAADEITAASAATQASYEAFSRQIGALTTEVERSHASSARLAARLDSSNIERVELREQVRALTIEVRRLTRELETVRATCAVPPVAQRSTPRRPTARSRALPGLTGVPPRY